VREASLRGVVQEPLPTLRKMPASACAVLLDDDAQARGKRERAQRELDRLELEALL